MLLDNYIKNLKIAYYFMIEKGCFMCKFKPKSWGEYEFHLHSTHGISKEMFDHILKNANTN